MLNHKEMAKRARTRWPSLRKGETCSEFDCDGHMRISPCKALATVLVRQVNLDIYVPLCPRHAEKAAQDSEIEFNPALRKKHQANRGELLKLLRDVQEYVAGWKESDPHEDCKFHVVERLAVAIGRTKLLRIGAREVSYLRERLAKIAAIIEAVDQRAAACDGPVTPTLQEMTQEEISQIYRLAHSSITR